MTLLKLAAVGLVVFAPMLPLTFGVLWIVGGLGIGGLSNGELAGVVVVVVGVAAWLAVKATGRTRGLSTSRSD